MSVNGIGTDKYMGETYQERLGKITDPHAKSAFQAAYAKKMAGSTDYVSTISKTYNTGKAGAVNFADAFPMYDVLSEKYKCRRFKRLAAFGCQSASDAR